MYILPETNIVSENQWLEELFPFDKVYIQGYTI